MRLRIVGGAHAPAFAQGEPEGRGAVGERLARLTFEVDAGGLDDHGLFVRRPIHRHVQSDGDRSVRIENAGVRVELGLLRVDLVDGGAATGQGTHVAEVPADVGGAEGHPFHERHRRRARRRLAALRHEVGREFRRCAIERDLHRIDDRLDGLFDGLADLFGGNDHGLG